MDANDAASPKPQTVNQGCRQFLLLAKGEARVIRYAGSKACNRMERCCPQTILPEYTLCCSVRCATGNYRLSKQRTAVVIVVI